MKILFFLFICFLSPLAAHLNLSEKKIEEIARRIWQNECSMSAEKLTSWNEGEEFASLGIGHFIWYPEGKKGPFEEQFPAFIAFAKSQGLCPPSWLTKECPWSTREEFLRDIQSKKMVELRDFLMNSFSQQALFICQKIEKLQPKITHDLSNEQKKHVIEMWDKIVAEPQGLYALIDYLNFKGDGLSPRERYKNKGWGLLQVLEEMPGQGQPVKEFVESAKVVLTRRVENSPPERNEKRWLKGWFNRLDTYL